MRSVLSALCYVFLLLGSSTLAPADEQPSTFVEVPTEGQPVLKAAHSVEARDEIRLATDVYVPSTTGQWPTILIRTPYNKENMSSVAAFFAQRGYSVVLQDTRGKYGSEGSFLPMRHEKSDGLDTLKWIQQQVWTTGDVGIWGPSYLGYAGLILVGEHPSVKTAININSVLDQYSFTYPNGNFHLMAMVPWLYAFEGRKQVSITRLPLAQLYAHQPVSKIMEMAGKNIDFWDQLIRHPDYDDFHRGYSVLSQAHKVDVPILHVAGFNDWLYRDTIDYFLTLADKSEEQYILIGPWYHNQEFSSRPIQVGDAHFGSNAAVGDQLLDMNAAWFDRWLKNEKASDFGMSEHVRYYVMNEDKWLEAGTWPPATVSYKTFFLSSHQGANSVAGDGKLVTDISATSEGSSSFTFDPDNPVRTHGGANYHMNTSNKGIRDQSWSEQRQDVLVFETDPLEKTLRLTGPLNAVIYVSTSGNDTDFVAKLTYVDRRGYSRIIEDTIISLSHRQEVASRQPVTPDEIYKLQLDLGDTAIVLPAGSRLRLDITSSNWPKYPVNPNTGESPLTATRKVTVTNTVHHGKSHPSQLILPVDES